MGHGQESSLSISRRRPWVMLLLLSAGAGIPRHGVAAQPQWTILACLDTRGGLSQAVDQYQLKLSETCRRRGFGLVVQRLTAAQGQPGATATTRVLQDGIWREPEVRHVAGMAEAIGHVGPDILKRVPARYVMLLVVAHGRGLLQAREAGISARELAGALTALVTELGRPLDVLGLDTCFGASLENLWELRGTAGCITAAPGVIYSPGLRWDEALAGESARDPRVLAEAVTQLGMSEGNAGAALVSIDTSHLPAVVAAVRGLAEALGEQMPQQGHIIGLARSRTRSWGQRSELCDVAELAAKLALNAADPATQAAAQRVQTAVADSLIAQWWGGGGGPPGAGYGVGVYFPPTFEEIPASYEGLQFAEASDWYRCLRQYWEWVSSPVVGQTNPTH